MDEFFGVAAGEADFEDVDNLVYTAGELLQLVVLMDFTAESSRQFFETRYLGAPDLVRAVAPTLRVDGSITLTSGTAGDRPGGDWALVASLRGRQLSPVL
ncbi:hypothetical protein [Rhodococcus qingshengii]|uniref:hypothetical protein n=1 Tax=Rhodococcus qingshengii TaxID=334542 RepID=UPI00071D2846|nr:hypothetical protein [Rhodococcus qingshengii]KSU70891.1 hypothetical protein AS032_26235 [Rhodococcus qingshengii]SCC62923.1 hypothetical protein GA0061093_11654 [Rhodococcus qingshengii]